MLSTEISLLLEDLKAYCTKNELSLALAESVTAGLLSYYFSTVDRAQDFFQGGICTYNNAQKTLHLNIDPILSDKYQGVHPEISAKMAAQVCRLFRATVGLGITGFATPSEADHRKGQYAYLALVIDHRLVLEERLETAYQGPLAQQDLAIQSITTVTHFLRSL